ncbi:hypothetical protein B0A50_04419 [Salinomyces thailandicus]|uniref:CREG-like beta-barrel domain-containing protein n=1 Tax=Salinomyces thailandicus TaxID=706561 RepID=A0A4U0TYS9_9PEZI|nr:hypothetical protein B0A50_04419 [Salinomyces thailandica]
MAFVSFLLAALASSASARSLALPPILQQEPLHQGSDEQDLHVPTVHESAVMARRIMHLSSLSTLITTFPNASSSYEPLSDTDALSHQEVGVWENRPSEMAGSPIGLMEYYADCEPTSGNPTLLAIDIATPYKNFAQGSNISMHIRWWPTQKTHYFSPKDDQGDDDIPTPHTPAALPRFSLHGRLEPIGPVDLTKGLVPACFLKTHPDSALWQPGNDIHTSHYVRFVVEHVYWFGGFGDRARIGWLPLSEWQGVTNEEIMEMRLPGESNKGRKHHSKGCREQRKGGVIRGGRWWSWTQKYGLGDW